MLHLAPLALIVPAIAGHLNQLAGNDLLLGRDGADVITGDDLQLFAPSAHLNEALMARVRTMTNDLWEAACRFESFAKKLAAVTGDHGPAMSAGRVVDRTLSLGDDTIVGGDGDDIIAGDDTVIVAPSFSVPVGLLSSFREILDDLGVVRSRLGSGAANLIVTEHLLRDVVTYRQSGKKTHTQVIHHIDRISLANDSLDGGAGADLVAGDNISYRIPSLTVIDGGAPGLLPPRLAPACRDHHHVEKWHDTADDVAVGNDRIDGGAGNDILLGDTVVFADSLVSVDAPLTRPNRFRLKKRLKRSLIVFPRKDLPRQRHGSCRPMRAAPSDTTIGSLAGQARISSSDRTDTTFCTTTLRAKIGTRRATARAMIGSSGS
jgi:Ca2+-binding RTX toxin-like protein